MFLSTFPPHPPTKSFECVNHLLGWCSECTGLEPPVPPHTRPRIEDKKRERGGQSSPWMKCPHHSPSLYSSLCISKAGSHCVAPNLTPSILYSRVPGRKHPPSLPPPDPTLITDLCSQTGWLGPDGGTRTLVVSLAHTHKHTALVSHKQCSSRSHTHKHCSSS